MSTQRIDWYEVNKEEAKRYRKAKAFAKTSKVSAKLTREPKRKTCGCLPWEDCNQCHWRLEEY